MSVNSFNASNPPLTTKGDLYGFSTVPARVPVGTDGQVLTADSTIATGVKWATPASGTLTWTGRDTGFGTTAVRKINYNGFNLYVVVGGAGKLSTSPNGITWTTRTSGFGTTQINDVAYGAGIWVAVGDSGIITTSSDGITWTARTSNLSTNSIIGVIYANSLFVAYGAGANTTGGIATSPDGITWTRRSVPANTITTINSIAYGSGYWLAVGIYNATSLTDSIYSTDATTWVQALQQNTNGTTYSLENTVFANSRFCSFNSTDTAVFINGVNGVVPSTANGFYRMGFGVASRTANAIVMSYNNKIYTAPKTNSPFIAITSGNYGGYSLIIENQISTVAYGNASNALSPNSALFVESPTRILLANNEIIYTSF